MNDTDPKKTNDKPPFKDTPDTPISAAQAGKAQGKPAARPSRASGFLHSATRWLLVALIFFVLGGLASYITFYEPASKRMNDQKANLEQAQQKVTDLETQVTNLQSLDQENKDLQAEHDSAVLHTALLSVYADTLEARLALANKKPADANLALTNTAKTLTALKSLLPEAQQPKVAEMESRLELSLKELEKDAYAAQSDLDVLATQLMQLENALFTKP